MEKCGGILYSYLVQIYGFGFIKNVSAYTLYRLKNIDCCYLLCGSKSIDKYLEFLLHGQPEYILGLGQFFGEQDKIRIETKCYNNFSDRPLNKEREFEEAVMINLFLKPLSLSKFFESIGDYYCNLVSWKIMELINQGELKSKYTFLHIPKQMPVNIAMQEIDQMLSEFKTIQV